MPVSNRAASQKLGPPDAAPVFMPSNFVASRFRLYGFATKLFVRILFWRYDCTCQGISTLNAPYRFKARHPRISYYGFWQSVWTLVKPPCFIPHLSRRPAALTNCDIFSPCPSTPTTHYTLCGKRKVSPRPTTRKQA